MSPVPLGYRSPFGTTIVLPRCPNRMQWIFCALRRPSLLHMTNDEVAGDLLRTPLQRLPPDDRPELGCQLPRNLRGPLPTAPRLPLGLGRPIALPALSVARQLATDRPGTPLQLFDDPANRPAAPQQPLDRALILQCQVIATNWHPNLPPLARLNPPCCIMWPQPATVLRLVCCTSDCNGPVIPVRAVAPACRL